MELARSFLRYNYNYGLVVTTVDHQVLLKTKRERGLSRATLFLKALVQPVNQGDRSVYMYMNIYTHTYIHTHMINTSEDKYTEYYTRIHTCTSLHTCTYVYIVLLFECVSHFYAYVYLDFICSTHEQLSEVVLNHWSLVVLVLA